MNNMSQHLSRELIGEKGELLYQQKIRALVDLVDTESNIGKMLSLDVETGDYEIDDVGITSAVHLLERRPGASIYGIRISADAVHVFDSGLNAFEGEIVNIAPS